MDRTAHEPSWFEVSLGAALSVALGVALGAAALVFRPVAIVKELPKEPVAGVTYYVEGAKDANKAKLIMAKRKAFAQGSSGTFSIVEDELNSLVTPAAPAAAAAKSKPGEKAGAAPANLAAGESMAVGTLNFRINRGVIQIGVPVTLGLLGAELKVFVQAQGGFVKKEGRFVFEPDAILFGSCPLNRLPFAAGYVMNKFLSSQTVAEDIAGMWPKVANVVVEGSVLKITLP